MLPNPAESPEVGVKFNARFKKNKKFFAAISKRVDRLS
jgi:hypothetical protein